MYNVRTDGLHNSFVFTFVVLRCVLLRCMRKRAGKADGSINSNERVTLILRFIKRERTIVEIKINIAQ